MTKLILTRHGQSTWNAENRFTGWVDVDLSNKGIEEAEKSGQIIKDLNIKLEISYTSFLKRAIKTLTRILKKNSLNVILSKYFLFQSIASTNNYNFMSVRLKFFCQRNSWENMSACAAGTNEDSIFFFFSHQFLHFSLAEGSHNLFSIPWLK